MSCAAVTITLLPYDEKTLKLDVPYDVPTIEKVKQLPRRQWSDAEKCWFIPNDRSSVKQVIELFGSKQVMDCSDLTSIDEAGPERAALHGKVVPMNEQARADALMERLKREMRARNFSVRTIKNYRLAVSRFLSVIDADPLDIGQDDLKQFLIDLHEAHEFAPRTVNLWASAISFFYQQVLGCAAPVSDLPRMKVGRPLPEVYSEEEVGGILGAVDNPKHRLILMIAYGCGLRLSELRNLKPEDISIERRLITVRHGKGNKDRTVMIDDTLLPAIVEYLERGRGKDWLFEGNEPGHRLAARTIALVFEHACARAGIKRRGGIHGFRHSFATHLMDHGTGLRQVQVLLGHGSSKTTEIYTHVSNASILKIRSPLANIKLPPKGKNG
ncbi:MAG: site-specific integrase [Chitinispirillaceae bacterium]|nr:site-specific integrase [Chitinispirillaceae bacterium]